MLKRSRLAALAAAAAVTLLTSVTQASPASATAGPLRYLINGNSKLCLAVAQASEAGGAPVIQYTCDNLAEQMWYNDGFKYVGGVTYYEFVNWNSGKCLAVPGANGSNNVQLIQYGCYGGNEQYWTAAYQDSWGRVEYRNLATGKCMAVGGSSLTPGAPVIQWTCTQGSEQVWTPAGI